MGGERELRYELGAGGRLKVCEGVEVIQDCRKAIQTVLEDAYVNGKESLNTGGIIEEVRQRFNYNASTIHSNLSRMVSACDVAPDGATFSMYWG